VQPFIEWFNEDRKNFADALLEIVQLNVILNKNIPEAVDAIFTFVASPPVELVEVTKKFTEAIALLGEKEQADFKKYQFHANASSSHMEKYLSQYLPIAGFEIAQTHRYTEFTGKTEAAIYATKNWKKGEQMKQCTGTVITLSAAEEDSLGHRDFSLVYSRKYNTTSMFLGKH
jgi:hypothetical protein